MFQHNNVGLSESAITKLKSEHAVSGTDASSPAKCYKMSRHRIVVDNFNQEPFKDTHLPTVRGQGTSNALEVFSSWLF